MTNIILNIINVNNDFFLILLINNLISDSFSDFVNKFLERSNSWLPAIVLNNVISNFLCDLEFVFFMI
jgi:hypothetical protein